jgi:hypothetical protein
LLNAARSTLASTFHGLLDTLPMLMRGFLVSVDFAICFLTVPQFKPWTLNKVSLFLHPQHAERTLCFRPAKQIPPSPHLQLFLGKFIYIENSLYMNYCAWSLILLYTLFFTTYKTDSTVGLIPTLGRKISPLPGMAFLPSPVSDAGWSRSDTLS